jgi:hypothetical protein
MKHNLKMIFGVLIFVFMLYAIYNYFNYNRYSLIEGFKKSCDKKETFVNQNQYGEAKGNDWIMNPTSWSNVNPSTILNTKNLVSTCPHSGDFFHKTMFKPSCCKDTSYSGSNGCACLSKSQFNCLATRGGNNIPFSEY